MQSSDQNNILSILQNLNQPQRAAVEYCTGPSLVIAGAGSGKTRVLTYKIAYLLEKGLQPYQVLALTFTNKAAHAMKQRIGELVGEKKAHQLWMGTFHSIFARILRYEAENIGFDPNFTIFDTADSNNLIKLIIKEMELDDKQYKPSAVHNQISRAKNALILPEAYAQNTELLNYDNMTKRPQLFKIYQHYQNRLRQANSMDFDDLLTYTNVLFRNHAQVLEKYRNQFQYILVDEYQDTNFAQHLIVKQLADAHHRVCVVGDDAQSIYSFRGANIDNILNFKTTYPETQIFKLEQNYRSTKNIVNAANSLIKKNKEQIFKNVFSENEEGEKIELLSAFSDFEEGHIISNKIARMRYENHTSYADFAILYRTNAQSRIFEEALRKKNIPYRIYGGLSFYQRKEIKDVINYFRLIINPNDETAFRRVINYPARGIGEVTIGKITHAAQLHNAGLWDIICQPLTYNLNVNAGTAKKLEGFQLLIADFIAQNKKLNAYDLALYIIKNSGISKEIYNDITPEGLSRSQNIQELLNAIDGFVAIRMEQDNNAVKLIDFLSEVSLLTDQDTDKDSDNEKVTLMTVHSAKGLEFKHVFVVGMEEDLFPSSRAKNESRGLEEERRLFYVAITRAKQSCTLSFAKSRFKNGSINASRASQFLEDIDKRFLLMERNTLLDAGAKQCGGFRESFHEAQSSLQSQKKYTPIKRVASYTPISEEVKELHEGYIIEHERFGQGVVESIEFSGEDKRATVNFEQVGKKQLLLKFARFQIIKTE